MCDLQVLSRIMLKNNCSVGLFSEFILKAGGIQMSVLEN